MLHISEADAFANYALAEMTTNQTYIKVHQERKHITL